MIKNKRFLIIFLLISVGFSLLILSFKFKSKEISVLVNRLSKRTLLSRFRSQTYKTDYYQKKVKAFQQQPRFNENIVLVGDSLTDSGPWEQLLNSEQIINQGISGDTTVGVLNRIDEIIKGNPKKIFIMIGVNDFWNAKRTVAQISVNYQKILTIFQEQAPDTKVYIQSLLPINNRDYPLALNNQDVIAVNERLEQFATQFNYQYIDIYGYFIDESNQLNSKYTNDGVHINGEGYRLWAEIISKFLSLE